jgi:peptide/nickel transport system substrate-binding protein
MEDYPNFGVLMKTEDFRNRILFFNTRKDTLKDKNIRIGLSYLLDKETLLSQAPLEGEIMQGPISSSSWAFNNQVDYYAYNYDKAVAYLSDAGYTKNADTGYFETSDGKILSFTLSYLDNDVNNRVVNKIVELYDREGVVIKPNKLSYNEISQQVIATRDFEILFYEVETTVDPDQYNLWHSLKVNYPDLNLSGYEYNRVDILLEDARQTNDITTRQTKYYQFQKYLMADAPAIFLYHPTFVYYFNSNLTGIDMSNINFSYERFWNIEDWKWN